MRNLAEVLPHAGPLDIWNELPEWINSHHSGDDDRRYAAMPLAVSGDRLTLTVEMTGACGLIARYKCDVSHIYELGRSWLVFSPLVVIWEQSRAERGPGIGEAMIAHFVTAVRTFQQARAPSHDGIVIASGNLTVAKGGKPFFEGIAWEIVVPDAREPRQLFEGDEAMTKPLTMITAQIEAAIAPLRAAGKVAEETISFAILRL